MKVEVSVSYRAIIDIDAKNEEEIDKMLEDGKLDEDKIVQQVLDHATNAYGNPELTFEEPMKADLRENLKSRAEVEFVESSTTGNICLSCDNHIGVARCEFVEGVIRGGGVCKLFKERKSNE